MEKGLACIWIRSNRGWHLLFPRFVNCYFVLPLNLTVQRLLLSFTNLYVYWPCRLFWVFCVKRRGETGVHSNRRPVLLLFPRFVNHYLLFVLYLTLPRNGSLLHTEQSATISTFCQPLFCICVVSYSSKKWFLASHTLREIECQTGRSNDKLGDRTTNWEIERHLISQFYVVTRGR